MNQDKLDLFDQAAQYICDAYFLNLPGDTGKKNYEYIQSLKAIREDHPWYTQDRFHFTCGMGVRNSLRENGFGEKEFGIDNLDDLYIGIIEKALELYENATRKN